MTSSDPIAVAPRFRRDVEVIPQDRVGVAPRYVVRDPITERVFILSEDTYRLCQELDGESRLEDVAARYAARWGASLPPADVETFVRQLASDGLLEGGLPPLTLPERLEGRPPHVQIPLMHADPMFATLERWTGWLAGGAGRALTAATIAAGVLVLLSSWTTYTETVSRASRVWAILPAVFYLLVGYTVRVVAQCVLLKRYDRQILDLKLTLVYYVVPLLEVDLTDALFLREKPKRRNAILVGIVAQVVVWALAILAWRVSTPGTTANAIYLALSVGMLGGLLLISLNPLIETDGYALLCMWLQTSRLRMRALRAFGDWLYLRPYREVIARHDRRWLTAYGALCTAYFFAIRGIVVWGVGTGLASDGAGAMTTFAFGVLMFEQPLGSYAGDFRPLRRIRLTLARFPRPVRWGGAALLALLIGLIPYPYEVGGPMFLLPTRRTEITAEVEGLVSRVFVTEGQRIDAGTPVAELARWEYEVQLEATRKDLIAKEAELELLRLGPKPEVIQRAEFEVQRAEEQVRSSTQQLEAVQVRLRYSQAHLGRFSNLFANDAIARQDYDNVLRERDMAKEQLDVAQAQLSVNQKALDVARVELQVLTSGPRPEQVRGLEAEVDRLRIMIGGFEEQLRLTVLRSPVAGRIITPHVQQSPGHYVRKGEAFAVVEESSTIQAEVQVPEEDVGSVTPDARVKVVTWTYPNRTFLGRVLFVAPVAATSTPEMHWKVVRVLTELPNDDAILKPAMTGYAKIAAEWRPLWKVFLWPPIRWMMVQLWYWLP